MGFFVDGRPIVTSVSPKGHIDGADLVFASTSSVEIGRDGNESVVRDSTNVIDITFTGKLTATITDSGAGGLDTGVEAANTWYAIYLIGDISGINSPAALISASPTAPTLPPGYDVFRRIGWTRNDASSDFTDFVQSGTGRTRSVSFLDTIANRAVLSGGAATAWTSVDCSDFVPPGVVFAAIQLRTSGAAAVFGRQVPGPAIRGVNSDNDGFSELFPVSGSRSMAYINLAGGGATDIWVVGYNDEL